MRPLLGLSRFFSLIVSLVGLPGFGSNDAASPLKVIPLRVVNSLPQINGYPEPPEQAEPTQSLMDAGEPYPTTTHAKYFLGQLLSGTMEFKPLTFAKAGGTIAKPDCELC
jgi:hypothetical protein